MDHEDYQGSGTSYTYTPTPVASFRYTSYQTIPHCLHSRSYWPFSNPTLDLI